MSDLDVTSWSSAPARWARTSPTARTSGGCPCAPVEDHLVGGECTYYACIPQGAAATGARARREPARARGGTGPIDVAEVLARRDGSRNPDDSGQVEWLGGAGITCCAGTAARRDRRRGHPTSHHDVRAARVVLATGTVRLPPIEGLARGTPGPTRRPPRKRPAALVVLGGGVVGVRDGAGLPGPRLAGHAGRARGAAAAETEEPGRLVGRARGRRRRAALHVETAVRRDGAEVSVSSPTVRGARRRVLVAAGRRPATTDIGLDTIGLEPGGYLDGRRRVVVSVTGSTRSATSTGATCSRTWASTRPALRRRDRRAGERPSSRPDSHHAIADQSALRR